VRWSAFFGSESLIFVLRDVENKRWNISDAEPDVWPYSLAAGKADMSGPNPAIPSTFPNTHEHLTGPLHRIPLPSTKLASRNDK
jgi:hypothetical protein